MENQSAVRSERSFWKAIQEMALKTLELDKTPRTLQRLFSKERPPCLILGSDRNGTPGTSGRAVYRLPAGLVTRYPSRNLSSFGAAPAGGCYFYLTGVDWG